MPFHKRKKKNNSLKKEEDMAFESEFRKVSVAQARRKGRKRARQTAKAGSGRKAKFISFTKKAGGIASDIDDAFNLGLDADRKRRKKKVKEPTGIFFG